MYYLLDAFRLDKKKLNCNDQKLLLRAKFSQFLKNIVKSKHGNYLDRFAQTHFVGQNNISAIIPTMPCPGNTFQLVGMQT